MLKLKFQDRVLNRLYDDFDDTAIDRKENETLSIEVVLPENEWLYGYLLSFGIFVEVLAPPHIRIIIIDLLDAKLKHLQNALQRRVFWTQYINVAVCPIYQCVKDYGYKNCSDCSKMPCETWFAVKDPATSNAEHQKSIDDRVAKLLAAHR